MLNVPLCWHLENLKSQNTFILESTHHRMRRVRAHVCARSTGLLHSRCAAGTRCVSLPFVRVPCFPVWTAASNEPVGRRQSGKRRRRRENRHFYPPWKRRSDGKATLRTGTFVRLCAARSSISSFGIKGETFLREIKWEVSKERLFPSLKAPTNVSALRLYLNPLW